MKKIIFIVLVLMSFVACSNGSTSHNDEPVYTPTTVTTSDSTVEQQTYIPSDASVDNKVKHIDYYTCDYLAYVDDNIKEHYYASAEYPIAFNIDNNGEILNIEYPTEYPNNADGIESGHTAKLEVEKKLIDYGAIPVKMTDDGTVYLDRAHDYSARRNQPDVRNVEIISLHKVGNNYYDMYDRIVLQYLRSE